MTIENRTISGRDSSATLTEKHFVVSTTSVNRYRKNILNFNYWPPNVKQVLSQEQILKRFVFSDESRFCLNNDDQLLWYNKNEFSEVIFFLKNQNTKLNNN